MSRHRAIRNRTYSYDDDYDDDYYDEEEEEEYYDEHDPEPARVAPPAPAPSLSSYIDIAAASAGKKGTKTTPSKGDGGGNEGKNEGGGGGGSTCRKGAARELPPFSPDQKPGLATVPEDFDADLVDPAFDAIKASGKAGGFTDDSIRVAVRQANYDADIALMGLLGASSRECTPSPPPSREGTPDILSPPHRVDSPSPSDVLSRAAHVRGAAHASSGSGASTPKKGVKGSHVDDVLAKANASLMKSRSPAGSRAAGLRDIGSPPPGADVVASRQSLGSIHRDAEVWEEDSPPMEKRGGAAAEKEVDGKVRISMVVIGHVDAGKSTLMGQILVGTGLVSEREVRKYEKEAKEMGKASFYLAWLMDEDSEERAHGVTMDIAHKTIETPKRVVTLLDAPGHQDYIPQMITGAAQADVALLVVPATTGEFEAGFESNGQTKEHALLARSLGVTQLLVAINKLDAADPPWSKARNDAIVVQLGPFLEATGYKAERITYVPVSGLTGENVVKRTPAGALEEWYRGPTLLGAIDDLVPGGRLAAENRVRSLRIFVTDVAQAGKNVVVRARVVQGALRSGSKVLILPIGDVVTVRGVEVEGRLAEYVVAGEHADMTLQGVDIARVSVGDVLCKGKNAVPVTSRFLAQITTLPSLRFPILRGTQFQLHMQSLELPTNATRLAAVLKKGGTGEIKQEKPRCLMGGLLASVEFRCQRPICVERFEDSRSLGRFVLRQKGETVAVGMVMEVLPDSG